MLIRWVPLGAALVEESPLAGLQASFDPKTPLDSLDEPARDRAIRDICREILSALGQYVVLDTDARQMLKDRVQETVGRNVDLGDEIGCGDYSVIYAGKRGPRPVAVKAIVESPFQSWVLEAYQHRLEKALRLRDRHFIHIYDYTFDNRQGCVVMEPVEGATLAQRLEVAPEKKLSDSLVASILHQIAGALEEAHGQDLIYGALRPVNIFIDDADDVRMSALDLSNETLRSERMRNGVVTTYDLMTYMTPEQYVGEPITRLTDQYSLGLLALELLNGEPPVKVRQASHLEQKRAFFARPAEAFGDWQRTFPGLARVVLRLLQPEPQARFKSMAEVAQGLQAAIRFRAAEAAKSSFSRCCAPNLGFYEQFYRHLQDSCPEIRPYFSKLDMSRQAVMLDQAIELMLNFHPGPEPTTLSRTADRHRKLGLRSEYFDHFFAAFVEALQTFSHEDEPALEAWRQALSPGIDYMKNYCQSRRPA
jgi:serine/threonine protein kinase